MTRWPSTPSSDARLRLPLGWTLRICCPSHTRMQYLHSRTVISMNLLLNQLVRAGDCSTGCSGTIEAGLFYFRPSTCGSRGWSACVETAHA